MQKSKMFYELVVCAFFLLNDILLCNSLVQSSVWKHEPAYDDRISDDYVLDRVKTASMSKCVGECDKRTGCASIFYMKTSLLCQLHSVRYPAYSSGVQKYSHSKVGTKYYYNIKENAITTTKTTTPTTSLASSSATTTTPITSLASSSATSTTKIQHCPNYEYLPVLNKSVTILPEVYVWDRAHADCISSGGHLMSVKDNKTMVEIANYAGRNGAIALWVNARLDDQTDVFVWQDDHSPLTYSKLWYTGQPQYPQKNTKCVMMLQMFQYRLDDTECTNGNLIHPLCFCV